MADTARYRIMVIDDDVENRLMVLNALSVKYEVVTAHDGLDGLEKLERYQPDFVILDMMMPLVDGVQTCQAIRRSPSGKEIPVMFLSAHSSKEQIAKIYECGGSLFLPKPIDPVRLLRNVDLFFETSPPLLHKKILSFEQIQRLEQGDRDMRQSSAERAVSSALIPPVLAPARAESSSPNAPLAPPQEATTPRALFVEDDRDLVELVRVAFADVFETVVAENGIEAIEKMVRYEPDLVLIDVMLPKMNGYQLCQSIRANRSLASTPIVFVTAKSSPRERDYAMKLGADAFLGKPFEIPALVELCLQITHRPGFAVKTKKVSGEELRAHEKIEERTRPKRRSANAERWQD